MSAEEKQSQLQGQASIKEPRNGEWNKKIRVDCIPEKLKLIDSAAPESKYGKLLDLSKVFVFVYLHIFLKFSFAILSSPSFSAL